MRSAERKRSRTFVYGLTCARCQNPVAVEDVDLAYPFPCSECSQVLEVTVWYRRVLGILSSIIAVGILYGLGIRGWLAFFLWPPASFLVLVPLTLAAKFLFPPKLEKHISGSDYSGPLGLGGA